MNTTLEYIKKEFNNINDLTIREIEVQNSAVYVVFFESLCSSKNIYDFILRDIINAKKIKNIKSLIAGPKIKEIINTNEIYYYLENGYAVVIFKDEIYAVEVKAEIDRGITASDTEPNMYGPKDAFCENYQKNLGIIKRRIKNKDLKIESIDEGSYTKTKVSLLYLGSKVNMQSLNKIKSKLSTMKGVETTDSEDIRVKLKTNILFPTILKTEKAEVCAKYLLNGYIVLLIDNSPFVLILNAKLKDFINPSTTDKFIRILRYICLVITLLAPAVYIALINFNQESLPLSLLLNFSVQRDGVPFPAIVEAIIMLLICEILREVDIRFPSNYGSSASILGALILGDAAVSAGVVSPIMIIVIALTFISSLIFTEISLVWTLRIIRFILLLASSIFGLYGLSISIITLLALTANVNIDSEEYI